jgi:small nuclear ribonucleoprotein (snRNP)-like protein
MINKDLNNLMNKKVNIKKKNGKIKIKINITPFIKK